MKLNQAEVKIITDVAAAGLEAAVNAYLQQRSEKSFVSIQFTTDAGTHTCYIVFTK